MIEVTFAEVATDNTIASNESTEAVIKVSAAALVVSSVETLVVNEVSAAVLAVISPLKPNSNESIDEIAAAFAVTPVAIAVD